MGDDHELDFTKMTMHVLIQFLAHENVLNQFLDALQRTVIVEMGVSSDIHRVEAVRSDMSGAMMYISWGANSSDPTFKEGFIGREKWTRIDGKWREIYASLKEQHDG